MVSGGDLDSLSQIPWGLADQPQIEARNQHVEGKWKEVGCVERMGEANGVNYFSYIVVMTLDILKTGLARRSDVPGKGRLADPRRGGTASYVQ